MTSDKEQLRAELLALTATEIQHQVILGQMLQELVKSKLLKEKRVKEILALRPATVDAGFLIHEELTDSDLKGMNKMWDINSGFIWASFKRRLGA